MIKSTMEETMNDWYEEFNRRIEAFRLEASFRYELKPFNEETLKLTFSNA